MTGDSNFWSENAAELADAYVRGANLVRFELVTRALLMYMPSGPQRVVDVGGGFGLQAIMLARAGHSVVIVDFDPTMLAIARNKLSKEPQEVSSRVELVLGDGNEAAELVGRGFDLVCCHSVLMYQPDYSPMLSSLIDLTRKEGLVSILGVNQGSYAMRSGLQGRWREAAAILSGDLFESDYAPSRTQTRDEVVKALEESGARIRGWHGVGVFTDHLTEKSTLTDLEAIAQVEWLAGNQEPYRSVARCFHIVAERSSREA